MLAQTITDTPGFGAAEWVAILTGISVVVGAITTLIVQIVRLRNENTEQHADNRQVVVDVRDRLLDLHQSVQRVDDKVENLDARLDRHENIHHRGKRRW
jgi:ubiquinone biosynthesis protein UbiJ